MKSYLVCPGWVQSANDGNMHYITAAQLMELYRVKPSECVVAGSPAARDTEGLVHLTVQYNGDYELPARHQPTWQDLSADDILKSHHYSVTRDKGCFHAGVLWAEAELRKKNAK